MEELERYAKDSIKKGAIVVVLIGSLVKENYTAFSDADVVIVVGEDGRRPMDRIPEFIDPKLPLDVEPRVYTISEMKTMAVSGSRIIEEILRHGKLLAGDPKVLDELRKLRLKYMDRRRV
jgi:predicted nucleotidyltransferase